MRIAAICIGAFILFAAAFVGGLGQAIYTYSACISAVAVILAGLASFNARWRRAAPWLLGIAGVAYLPVIYQRFAWSRGPDWGGLVLDILYMIFLARFIYIQGNVAARQANS
jgi:hypothetical protein